MAHTGHVPFRAQDFRLFFDKAIEPVLTVSSGRAFTVYTPDCTCGLIRTSRDLITSADELLERLGGLNFLTGPIEISGVQAGDILQVSLIDIEAAPEDGQGFVALVPGFGAVVHDNGFGVQEPLAPATTICAVTSETVTVPFEAATIELACRPLVGCIGVAPTSERRMTLSQSPDYVGDIDIPYFRTGSTLHLRANHPGGLLSIGDVHAAQGDGELTGIAVEVPALITLRIDVVSAADASMRRLPVLVDEYRIGVVAAFQGTSTAKCIQAAGVEMAGLLERMGFSLSDALQFLSVAAKVRIGNAFEPFYSVFMYVERAVLPDHLVAPDLCALSQR